MGAAKTYKSLEAAARAYGAEHGVTSRKGGWLYRNGAPLVQGWRKYGTGLVINGDIVPVDADGNVPEDWRQRAGYKVIERCSTVGCRREATEEVSYHYRGEQEKTTERVCTSCARGYARRPVLVGVTRVPLDPTVPVLQVYVRGWTALNSRGTWRTLRPATEEEKALAATIEHGQFWLKSDGTPYYHPFAKDNADRAVRVAVQS
jgi:hypothetical protein